MKRFLLLIFVLLLSLLIFSCVISNPKPEECLKGEVTIVKITEGSSYDIIFHSSDGDQFYINRGLKKGLNLDSLNAAVLNKTVTLHLARLFGGAISSEHIAQLAINDSIIYTEFE